jgi:putative ABC transport system substrate-binding protein
MPKADIQRAYRVGLLHVVGQNDTSINPVDMADFKQGMRDLGYREGVDVEFRECYGNRDLARVRRYADELVAWPADVIVSFLTNANLALMEATRMSRTPVVGWGTDHVVAGTAETNRRPGKNFTGFSYMPFIYGARVRMLRMAVPHARKVGHLYNHTYSPAEPGKQEYGEILNDFGIEMPVYEALRLEDLEPSVAAMKRDGCDAVMVGPHELFNTNGKILGRLFLEHRLPAFGNQLTIPEYGAVGAMGPPHRNGWPAMAGVVDRILKGANPAEIPINRTLRGPTVLNLKAAELLGLDLPAKLIDEADVILETVGAD